MSNDIARYQFQWPDEHEGRDVMTANQNVGATTLEKADDHPRTASHDDDAAKFSNETAQTTDVVTDKDPS